MSNFLLILCLFLLLLEMVLFTRGIVGKTVAIVIMGLVILVIESIWQIQEGFFDGSVLVCALMIFVLIWQNYLLFKSEMQQMLKEMRQFFDFRK